jgi:hypothetical protein
MMTVNEAFKKSGIDVQQKVSQGGVEIPHLTNPKTIISILHTYNLSQTEWN